jgi:hypothetical protein
LGINRASPEAQIDVAAATSGSVVSILRGAAGQTADLTQWLDSNGTTLAKVTASGAVEGNGLRSNLLVSSGNDCSGSGVGMIGRDSTGRLFVCSTVTTYQ